MNVWIVVIGTAVICQIIILLSVLHSFRKSIEESDFRISKLWEHTFNHTNEFDALKKSIGEFTEKLAAIASTRSETNQDIDKYILSIDRGVTYLRKEIADLGNRLYEIEEEMPHIRTQMKISGTALDDLADLEDRVAQLERGREYLPEHDLHSQICSLQERLNILAKSAYPVFRSEKLDSDRSIAETGVTYVKPQPATELDEAPTLIFAENEPVVACTADKSVTSWKASDPGETALAQSALKAIESLRSSSEKPMGASLKHYGPVKLNEDEKRWLKSQLKSSDVFAATNQGYIIYLS